MYLQKNPLDKFENSKEQKNHNSQQREVDAVFDDFIERWICLFEAFGFFKRRREKGENFINQASGIAIHIGNNGHSHQSFVKKVDDVADKKHGALDVAH